MTDLERRALLGDAEAQRECTEKGIVLPCPKCLGNNARYTTDFNTEMWFGGFVCYGCGFKQASHFSDEESALSDWNTRPALPIGRCKDCDNAGKWTDDEANCHANDGGIVGPDDFCSQFKPMVKCDD